MHTEIGKIAEMIQSGEDEATPLQRKLDELGKTLGVLALAICALIFVFGVIRDTNLGAIGVPEGLGGWLAEHEKELVELFMTAVSLAIAAVPEGLPAVVTICLALGMQRMVARHALIRKLPAVETLGSATVICSDKTGTLTQNEMTVVAGWAGGHDFQVTGEGYAPEGEFCRGETGRLACRPTTRATDPAACAARCSATMPSWSSVSRGWRDARWRMVGDPDRGRAGRGGGQGRPLARRGRDSACPRVAEIPFDSDRKRMTTIHRLDWRGWPAARQRRREPVRGLRQGRARHRARATATTSRWTGRIVPLTPELRQQILAVEHRHGHRRAARAGRGLQPLARSARGADARDGRARLIFLGLHGHDRPGPARGEGGGERGAERAGLKCIMITGDYKDTAAAIAGQIGLLTPGGQVVTGAELDAMSDDELDEIAPHLDACARSSPQHKVRIVDALQAPAATSWP